MFPRAEGNVGVQQVCKIVVSNLSLQSLPWCSLSIATVNSRCKMQSSIRVDLGFSERTTVRANKCQIAGSLFLSKQRLAPAPRRAAPRRAAREKQEHHHASQRVCKATCKILLHQRNCSPDCISLEDGTEQFNRVASFMHILFTLEQNLVNDVTKSALHPLVQERLQMNEQ